MALSVGPYVFFVTKAFSAISGKWEGRLNDASEAAADIFTETFTNIKTVRALTLEKYFLKKYEDATRYCLYIGMQRALYSALFYGLSESSGSFTEGLVFYMGAKVATEGTPVGHVTLVFLMLIMTITNISSFLGMIPQLSATQDSATRFLRLANLPTNSHEHIGTAKVSHIGDVDFRNLEFTYPSRPDQTVLKNVSFTVQHGESTAIVGSSGSGKSTIAALLLKLYPISPYSSTTPFHRPDITVSGRSISHIHTPTLRSRICIVTQTPALFAAKIAENITYGLPEKSRHNTRPSYRSAAARAGIDAFIMSLPDSYSTVIGEGGMGLSGGQAQRIAIARALVREPDVLVLDEATSALDVESARQIRETVTGLVREKGLTVVIITHAEEMMRIASQVVVLERGRVVEKGGFEELMRRGGALARMLRGGEWMGEGGLEDRFRDEVVQSSSQSGTPKLRDVAWDASGNNDMDGQGKGWAL